MGTQRIVILGAGIMQLPALRIARDEGLWTIAFDGNPNAMGKEVCDEFHVIDISDRHAVLEEARAVGDIGGIFTAGTDFSTSVAYTAEQLDLPGIDYKTALRATDKFIMRETLAAGGINVPEFRLVTGRASEAKHATNGGDADNVDDIDVVGIESLRPPLVIKPVDNMGARGVRRVDDLSEAREAIRAALPLSRTARVIVEELIPGTEYSLDAIVSNGRVRICGVGDRHIRFPPYFVEVGHTIPTELAVDKRTILEEAFVRAISVLGIDNGTAKGDIFLVEPTTGPPPAGAEGARQTARETYAVVGEIAARLSGGYMSGWTYPYASGVESTRAGIRIAMGWEPGLPERDEAGHAAERAILSIDGEIESYIGLDEARAMESVKDVFILREPGTQIRFPRTNVEKAGNIIAAAPFRRAAADAAEQAVAAIVPRLKAADERTFCYLFVDSCAHPAFCEFSDVQAHLVAELPALPAAAASAPVDFSIPPGPAWDDLDAAPNWAYATFVAAADRAQRYAQIEPCGAAVMALHRAGVQGLIFLVDTLTEDGTWFIDRWRHHKLPESPSRYFCS